jgi:F0F1-type ATP synthase assembly protein I
MEESIMGIIWFMLFSIGLIVMVIFLRKFTNIERMALIEKGEKPFQAQESNTSIPLRFSLLFIGFGLGLLIGYFLDSTFHMEEVAYFSMIFVFGGAGLGLAYIIEEKKAKEVNN